MAFEQIDPTRRYQVNGEVCPLNSGFVILAVGNDQTIIPAVSGKIHAVMGWIIQTNGAANGNFNLQDGAAGSIIHFSAMPSNAQPSDKLPIVNVPYFQTSVGNGLYTDVAGTGLTITIFYITYTPP